MRDYRHDIESYIITIKRRGRENTATQEITPTVLRMDHLINESGPCSLHDPQASYGSPAHQASQELSASGIATEISAPLPGIIIDLKVKVGDTVREGQELAVLEAMKMENSIESTRTGIVRSVNVSPGDTVSEGTVIMTIE